MSGPPEGVECRAFDGELYRSDDDNGDLLLKGCRGLWDPIEDLLENQPILEAWERVKHESGLQYWESDEQWSRLDGLYLFVPGKKASSLARVIRPLLSGPSQFAAREAERGELRRVEE